LVGSADFSICALNTNEVGSVLLAFIKGSSNFIFFNFILSQISWAQLWLVTGVSIFGKFFASWRQNKMPVAQVQKLFWEREKKKKVQFRHIMRKIEIKSPF
jgi:hypothetical protein